ncbi:MAG: glycosyltransferase family 4 protein [Pseudomonadales bacterium]|jgi:glycosyltransferase involved in cell wall biosynthesis|nr:glycosyltransferase family 4 protein [Pseudomonadales bacterium]
MPRAHRQHILFTLPDLHPGGGQVSILRTAGELARRGYRITALTVWRDTPPSMLDAYRATFDRVESLQLRRSRPDRALVRLRRLMRELDPDLVHATNTPWDLRMAVVGARMARVPIVNTFTSMLFGDMRTLARRLERRCFRGHLHGAVAVSPVVMDSWAAVMDAYEIPVDYRRTISPGILPFPLEPAARADARRRLREEHGIDERATVIVNLARLVPGKGQLDLVSAFARVLPEHPGAHLMLAGEGPQREALEHRIASLGLDGSVTLLGHRDDPQTVLAAGDLLAFPSHGEGFGLAVGEAMVAGLPVVAYDLPAVRWFCPDGEAGLLVRAGDVEAFAGALATLLGDPGLRSRMGANGMALIERDHLVGCCVDRLEELYGAVAPHRDRT